MAEPTEDLTAKYTPDPHRVERFEAQFGVPFFSDGRKSKAELLEEAARLKAGEEEQAEEPQYEPIYYEGRRWLKPSDDAKPAVDTWKEIRAADKEKEMQAVATERRQKRRADRSRARSRSRSKSRSRDDKKGGKDKDANDAGAEAEGTASDATREARPRPLTSRDVATFSVEGLLRGVQEAIERPLLQQLWKFYFSNIINI